MLFLRRRERCPAPHQMKAGLAAFRLFARRPKKEKAGAKPAFPSCG